MTNPLCTRTLWLDLRIGVLGGTVVAVASVLAWHPTGAEPWLVYCSFAGELACYVGIADGLAFLVSRSAITFRAMAWLIAFGLAAGLLPTVLAGLWQAHDVEIVAQRAKPLIAAIHAFEHERGRPPTSLSELVPIWLASIPGTGSGVHPAFQFQSNERGDWELRVVWNQGFLRLSRLLYYRPSPAVVDPRFRDQVERWLCVYL